MALLKATLVLGLALLLGSAQAFTYQNQTELLLQFKEQMLKRGPNWAAALKSWVCPTSPDGSCDPCGNMSWWGNFEHLGCRGDTVEAKDVLGGNGFITNVHITDYQIEGAVPAKELCGLKHLKEFDVDGGLLTGPIPLELMTCFPQIDEIDLSYNQLTGTIPPEFGTLVKLDELKMEHNKLSGTIPSELGNMTELLWLRMSDNNLTGTIPQSLRHLSKRMVQVTVDNNTGVTGTLYMLANHSLINAGTAFTQLCGMVPTGVRFAHGFNYASTGLGLPCPVEVQAGWSE